MNRDLSKVIVIDTNPEHVVSHPDNAIIMKHWNGEPGNKDLIAHIPFLECIGMFNVPDVRPILKNTTSLIFQQNGQKLKPTCVKNI